MPIQYFSAGGRKCAALIPKNTENSEPSLLCLMGGSDTDELFSSLEKLLLPADTGEMEQESGNIPGLALTASPGTR